MIRRVFLAAAVLVLAGVTAPAEARAHPDVGASCGYDAYVNANGHCVRRPVRAASRPTGATALCRDGSYSFSEHRRGTCSHHGGVAQWL
jgi:hypothetical protein